MSNESPAADDPDPMRASDQPVRRQQVAWPTERKYGPPQQTGIRRRLDTGDVAVVVAGHTVSADVADHLGRFGFDGYWIEAEHGPATWDRIADISRACELWGMTPLVRLPFLNAGLVGRALTLGAGGIVIPQVSTAAAATELVRAGRFAPRGQRGVSLGRRSYGRPRFLAEEADDVVLIVQLEDPAGLAAIDEICAVDGLDVVFIAPNDLAQAMGHQGDPGHPDVQQAIADGLRRIAANGMVPATNCAADRIEHFVGLGARLLYTNFDPWIAQGATAFLAAVDAASGTTHGGDR